jgi:hypothetical protein
VELLDGARYVGTLEHVDRTTLAPRLHTVLLTNADGSREALSTTTIPAERVKFFQLAESMKHAPMFQAIRRGVAASTSGAADAVRRKQQQRRNRAKTQ